MKRGLLWYQREPRAIIDGIRSARMTCRQAAIYNLLIDLIYEGGGETPDDPKYLAGHFTDVGIAAVRNTINDLVAIRKIVRQGDMLTQKRAAAEVRKRQRLSETRAETGREGGIASGIARQKSLFADGDDAARTTKEPSTNGVKTGETGVKSGENRISFPAFP